MDSGASNAGALGGTGDEPADEGVLREFLRGVLEDVGGSYGVLLALLGIIKGLFGFRVK